MGQCLCRKRKRQGDCQDAYRPGGSEEASRDDVPPSAEAAERLSTVDEAREIPPPPNPPMEGEGDEEIVPGWLFERHHIGAGDAGPVVGQDPPRHIPRAFQGVEGIGYLNFHLRITAEEVEGQWVIRRVEVVAPLDVVVVYPGHPAFAVEVRFPPAGPHGDGPA
ncbi:uncharacterized protein LOC124168348 [Ischnura elegans]|uniref:uncharacterized protein LOC124167560 n=1 Tax=Ischnura elegans TaxID=197161 RepID=UPI001ED87160|nr:uncharacterized protein LOC124167560 [Ischnura elegans]XP_046402498.1 uncharacterized protein LOC124168348 [Ischnura elegans]